MAKNVFTDRDRATNLAHEEDYDTTLRSILRDMFPNDPTFRSDGLYTDKTITTTEDGKSVVPITGKTKIKAEAKAPEPGEALITVPASIVKVALPATNTRPSKR